MVVLNFSLFNLTLLLVKLAELITLLTKLANMLIKLQTTLLTKLASVLINTTVLCLRGVCQQSFGEPLHNFDQIIKCILSASVIFTCMRSSW